MVVNCDRKAEHAFVKKNNRNLSYRYRRFAPKNNKRFRIKCKLRFLQCNRIILIVLQEDNCLQKTYTVDKNIPPSYCPRAWDHVMCWPPTAPASEAVQSCFEEFNGVLYDISRKCIT